MIIKDSLFIIGYTSWCGLGFYRGIHSSKYYHNKYEKNKNYLYINLMCNGFFGIIIYANPVCLPVSMYKEIYRLEVNLRNLENEKNSNFYNNLL
jgi:hypothetical protein